jgi:uncharacterized membrane protein
MLRIKVLNKKNHPFTNKIKLYGMSIEAILIGSFVLIVLLMAAYYIQSHKKKKQTNPHSITTDRALPTH